MSGEKIRWTNVDQPEFLWGPRPYSARTGAGGIPRFDMTIPRKVGNGEKAEMMIEVVEYGEGEIEYVTTCLCAACFEIQENPDVIDAVVDKNVYGKPEPGIYYVKHWVEEYGGYFEPAEYDGGLEIAE
jgi:hypothetical protein